MLQNFCSLKTNDIFTDNFACFGQLLRRYDFIIYTDIKKPPEEVTNNNFGQKIVLCLTNENHYDNVYTTVHINNLALCQSIVYEVLYKRVFELEEVDYVVNKMLHEKGPRYLRENHPFFSTTVYEARLQLREIYKNGKDLLNNGLTPFSYKVAKSLDSNIYRNVEFDTAKEQRQGYRHSLRGWNNNELKVGSKCSILFDDGNQTMKHYAYVQEMQPDKGRVWIFDQTKGETFAVNYDMLKLVPTPVSKFPSSFQLFENKLKELEKSKQHSVRTQSSVQDGYKQSATTTRRVELNSNEQLGQSSTMPSSGDYDGMRENRENQYYTVEENIPNQQCSQPQGPEMVYTGETVVAAIADNLPNSYTPSSFVNVAAQSSVPAESTDSCNYEGQRQLFTPNPVYASNSNNYAREPIIAGRNAYVVDNTEYTTIIPVLLNPAPHPLVVPPTAPLIPPVAPLIPPVAPAPHGLIPLYGPALTPMPSMMPYKVSQPPLPLPTIPTELYYSSPECGLIFSNPVIGYQSYAANQQFNFCPTPFIPMAAPATSYSNGPSFPTPVICQPPPLAIYQPPYDSATNQPPHRSATNQPQRHASNQLRRRTKQRRRHSATNQPPRHSATNQLPDSQQTQETHQ